MVQEREYRPLSGWLPLVVTAALLVGGPWYFFHALQAGASGWHIASSLVMLTIGFAMGFGFMAIAPNDSRVLLLFGEYKGSVRASGFFWVNPFFSKKKLSLRVRNFETGALSTPEKKDAAGKIVQEKTRTHGRPSKVNDRDGNPIDISAVVVWRVVNTVEALFEVDDYEDFVAVQSEAALRIMASRYPYDSEDHEISLRGDTNKISAQLRQDIQERLDKAGVEVIEARISHLAYASEIAAAMLQRQQAQAVVAARTKIVEGAVGMVQMALDHLARDQVVELDDERRAAMVSNLLVVLCSDRHTQPVVNTGTLYN
ncbi:SPFH domain-containing protein [Wenzhouxiangella sp. XN24]|uniref:SPFH domain-containing protein n=1 Tax=Wenzhouxiangella sp. XN24 TaxID=2713569 RepID=UPI0013EDC60C|nr:SPFH domain-containing protein [Wenzhouxiangella sp. XN24]NGX15616.1 SPFH domain-containing protein [Wenzhouxiangella sp. XN24]